MTQQKAPENGKGTDLEAVYERAAIMQFDGGLSKYHAERHTAELYGLTTEQRESIFPLPHRTGFEAVQFMAERGFKFIPWGEAENRPAVKWAGEHQKILPPIWKNYGHGPGPGTGGLCIFPACRDSSGWTLTSAMPTAKTGYRAFTALWKTWPEKPRTVYPHICGTCRVIFPFIPKHRAAVCTCCSNMMGNVKRRI
jgi:hypothetical protein